MSKGSTSCWLTGSQHTLPPVHPTKHGTDAIEQGWYLEWGPVGPQLISLQHRPLEQSLPVGSAHPAASPGLLPVLLVLRVTQGILWAEG